METNIYLLPFTEIFEGVILLRNLLFSSLYFQSPIFTRDFLQVLRISYLFLVYVTQTFSLSVTCYTTVLRAQVSWNIRLAEGYKHIVVCYDGPEAILT